MQPELYRTGADAIAAWLPALGDWPDLLNAADPTQRYRDQDDWRMCWLAEIAEWWREAPEFVDEPVPSPEMSAALLYRRVIGTEVGPGVELPKPTETASGVGPS